MNPFATHIAAAENRLDMRDQDRFCEVVEGFAPIHFAAAYCAASLEKLLKAGIDPTVQVQGGIYDSWEPVHFAAKHRQEECLKLLAARLDVPIERGFQKGTTARDLFSF